MGLKMPPAAAFTPTPNAEGVIVGKDDVKSELNPCAGVAQNSASSRQSIVFPNCPLMIFRPSKVKD